ncbi:MAG: chemotaxis protein CheW [Deltaproteobacteria bacterium]|nr:chemotaxis protein CheW [Deltaproteobacteria bacterium]
MEDIFSALVKDFVDETQPIALEVGAQVLKLEEAWGVGEDGKALLRSLRSGLHTIKGNAAMMGLSPVAQVAHVLEDVCARAAEVEPEDRPALVQALLEGGDLLVMLIRSAPAGSLDAGRADEFVARTAVSIEAARAAGASAGLAQMPTETGAAGVVTSAPSDGERGSARIADGDVDELLELAGEAIVGQTELLRVHARLLRGEFEAGDMEVMDRVLTGLGRTTREMRDRLLRVRLAPIATLFGRYGRYVRDLARERGQPIELCIEGGGTAVDRAIIRRLSEPLVHVVRNAVAHGIETAEERAAAGKPVKARILLGAGLREGRVQVTIADDGRGLDMQAIVAKAKAEGIDTSRYGEQDLQRLIFHAGFSTAKTVTELAGRGVGLDVVAGVVQGLGGRIDVRSTSGQGTVFTLDLPVTVSLQKALVFGVDSETFAVPTGFILDTVESREKDLQEINRVLLLSWRDDFVRATDAGRLLGCQGLAEAWARPYAIVLQAGNKRGALLVDWLSGVQEIVVKPLDAALLGCRMLSGATVLAQGKVVPILDCVEVVRRVNRTLQPERSGETKAEVVYDVF